MRETEVVLVVGGGGRESALVDKYAQSKDVGEVIAVPGNDLMQINAEKKVKTFPTVKTTDIEAIQTIIERESVSLVDVAQDRAVEAGVADMARAMDVAVVGPGREAGQIEVDKAWSRTLGEKIGLPQPSFKICSTIEDGEEFIRNQPEGRWFVKVSGLAEGKGAKPAHNNSEVLDRIKQIKKEYPDQSHYLIEKWVEGEEFSAFAVSDGMAWKILGSAQDHKRALDGDIGENTGGMGAISPPLLITNEINISLGNIIFSPTFLRMEQEGLPYEGVIYFGGMISEEFVKKENPSGIVTIEFNARWGDPEAQAIVPGLTGDFYQLSMAVASGNLSEVELSRDDRVRVVVAGASRGYPGDYSYIRGKEIKGLNNVLKMDGIKFYGAGVKRVDGKDYADGGRLFYIVGEGKTVIDARERAYEAMSLVSIEDNGLHFRTDIGWRDVQRIVNA